MQTDTNPQTEPAIHPGRNIADYLCETFITVAKEQDLPVEDIAATALTYGIHLARFAPNVAQALFDGWTQESAQEFGISEAAMNLIFEKLVAENGTRLTERFLS